MFVLSCCKRLVIGLSLLSLLGCSCFKRTPHTSNLSDLEKLATISYKSSVSPMRAQQLRDTALGVGARGGLAWRSAQINNVLTHNEALLYRIFNFNSLLLDKNILPPVLVEGRNTLTLAGPDVIRAADRYYQILKQARFVTAPPIWRDYLWLIYTTPECPDRTLLPRSRGERVLWKRYIDEGWQAGIQQADVIFKENLARLKRDYEGMLRYRTLLAQNMVSAPFVAELDMGVTGCGSDLTINDRVLRITAFPSLNCDSEEWKTKIIPYDGSALPAIIEKLPIETSEAMDLKMPYCEEVPSKLKGQKHKSKPISKAKRLHHPHPKTDDLCLDSDMEDP